MNTQKNILLAFVLNFAFSIFELIGGLFTGSVAILSTTLVTHSASACPSFLRKRAGKHLMTFIPMVMQDFPFLEVLSQTLYFCLAL